MRKGRMLRDLCKSCEKRPVAINYYKNNKPFYRSQCDHCAKNRKKERPLWALTGYKKKTVCDKCNFTSKFQEQFNVYYVDGNPSNCRPTNLKTVSANCQCILHKLKLPWRQGDLKPDF
jgi:hypothetical protein